MSVNHPARPASEFTARWHREALRSLPMEDRSAFADAARGLVAADGPPVVRDDSGHVVWDLTAYDFLREGEAPETVHPSLWRMARLNRHHGLFRVTDRVYQVRGYDIANMTVVVGDRGYIVIDPLTSTETATAALRLVREHLGDRPVTALLHTHCHVDHFGGARAVLEHAAPGDGPLPVIAPRGFHEHAVTEHVHAGAAMSRRSGYMFGPRLAPGPLGHVTASLGVSIARGTTTVVEPTHVIDATGTEMTIDGVEFVFQYAPDSEAPAEMNFLLPGLRALCMAETVSQQMHNLYTLRGAQVRDALKWSGYIDEALRMFAPHAEVMFISHHWPTWGRENIARLLRMHSDLYRYIHDETLRLANHGHTPTEIAEMVTLPPQLAGHWANRGCYGTLNHNVKAVYQRYLGWFDGNPATLHPLPPAEAGRRYLDLIGGTEPALEAARAAHGRGDYRWGAELLRHVLAVDPAHEGARLLQAAVFEQLGYQAESAAWRNFYLVGADELRHGVPDGRSFTAISPDLLVGMPVPAMLDLLAIRLVGLRASAHDLCFTFEVAGEPEPHRLAVGNGVLRHGTDGGVCGCDGAHTVLRLDRAALGAFACGASSLDALVDGGRAVVMGDRSRLDTFEGLLDRFTGDFEVAVTNAPRPDGPAGAPAPEPGGVPVAAGGR
ncbi:alkyl sulfatase dimerization domain-containing protein [Streptomyces sp. SID8352]|uniref:alkyl/aryl-sulfatase n=1 Tax=Streptomyces sp. SID8352 TaxID=2690338 RepID=UPI00136CC465|nr:alkyl sulfatase dimerization domain-containing protein [Streptomyces sp. SID8352]MYU20469.1 MBL fold metallo-hydrolase [Streptomyces sp. SID8352]